MFTTLISPPELFTLQANVVIVDCRFSLADTNYGRKAYAAGHIPRAVYAHLDEDLSGPIIHGKTSRHPLPDVNDFSAKLSAWGVDNDTQVVAYDDAGGAIAARLWWMLRWLGHDAVAVLNGGIQAWEANYPLSQGVPSVVPATFTPRLRPELLVNVETVAQAHAETLLIDSRTPERYRGEAEPIDPIAGHIPGAVNAPHPTTIGDDGDYLSPTTLRAHFETLLGDTSPIQAVFYCGSGVTAARNLLAMAYAGLGDGKLYAGSWSEWITDPSRPVATGNE